MAQAHDLVVDTVLRQVPWVAQRRVGPTIVLGDPHGGVEVMRLDTAAALLWDAFQRPRTVAAALDAVLTASGGAAVDVEEPAIAILGALLETGRLERC